MRHSETHDGAQRRAAGLSKGLVNLAAAVLIFLLCVGGDGTGASACPADTHTSQASPVALPSTLSGDDVARYREIFRLQALGRLAEADCHVGLLRNRLLMGHVLAQRHLDPRTATSFSDLQDWLNQYRDHPDAAAIHALARRKMPRGSKEKLPSPLYGESTGESPPVPTSPAERDRLTPANRREVAEIEASIRRHVNARHPERAEAILQQPETRRLLPAALYDGARAEVAKGYFLAGQDERAYRLAEAAGKRSGDEVAQAHWIAGLAAYRLDRTLDAARRFEDHAETATNGWNAAAGAFWAARMHMLNGDHARVSQWLEKATGNPFTFYGILARRALGIERPFDWRREPLTARAVGFVQSLPGGKRALALAQVDEVERAERELLRHVSTASAEEARGLMLVAEHARLPNLTLKAGRRVFRVEGEMPHRALYPLPPWTPADKIQIDRALLYAFMRQESEFKASATSSAGARGLMQLMPATASFVAGNRELARGNKAALYDPRLNIMLGQRYLDYLLRLDDIDGDLILLAAAYNGGPGNLAKWQRRMVHKDDPLLFIASMPSRETRNFVEKVIANLWIYQQRLGQPTLSLDAIAGGDWPKYVPLDRPDVMLAEDAPD
ncbi:MAG: lytic transglycosylase domain-containing protein [Alphaproteobacteria bacterium]|nr:lytic transglycosylase domain-containing protein [Alphaproteobacteria bacterium]